MSPTHCLSVIFSLHRILECLYFSVYNFKYRASVCTGGYDKAYHTDRASVECWEPGSAEWAFVAEMEKARSGLALVALDHYLYAFGGRARHNDQYFDMAER